MKTRPHPHSLRRCLVAAAALVLGAVQSAPAQELPLEMRAPPSLTPPNKPPSTFTGMLEAIFLGLVVFGVNFIPSKRGHQD